MHPTTSEEEEDGWFGDGSAFDSGEDLAAALLELAGVPADAAVALPAVRHVAVRRAAKPELIQRGRRDLIFEMLRPSGSEPEQDIMATARAHTWSSVNQPLTWTVRSPGSVSVPPRQPGKTGWSIRSSVQLLQRTEEVMQRVREEAVSNALVAAARAFTAQR